MEESRFGRKFADKRGGARRSFDRNRDDDRGFDRGGDRRMSRGTRFQIPSLAVIEYKNIAFLQKFVTERGKMVSRRFSGVTAKEQRALCVAIKRARYLGLLPVGSARRK